MRNSSIKFSSVNAFLRFGTGTVLGQFLENNVEMEICTQNFYRKALENDPPQGSKGTRIGQREAEMQSSCGRELS